MERVTRGAKSVASAHGGFEPPAALGDGRFLYRGKRLGGGAFGQVFEYEEPALRRSVAIKFFVSQQKTKPLMSAEEEAARLGELGDHPNIVTVLNVVPLPMELGANRIGVVMQYVRGQTLSDVVGKPHPPDEVIYWLERLISALCFAHSRSIFHRDLKPGNIILRDTTGHREPVVLDFGISAAAGEQHRPAGTRNYMAPEQYSRLDPASDFWPLGLMAFELASDRSIASLASGEEAKKSAHALGVRRAVLKTLDAVADERLRRAIRAFLSVEPDARVASSEDLRRALAGSGATRSKRGLASSDDATRATRGTLALRGEEVSFAYSTPVTVLLGREPVTIQTTRSVLPRIDASRAAAFPYIVTRGREEAQDAAGVPHALIAKEGGLLIVGRTEDQFSFPSTVSRRHVAITVRHGQLVVADLGSLGGTTVELHEGQAFDRRASRFELSPSSGKAPSIPAVEARPTPSPSASGVPDRRGAANGVANAVWMRTRDAFIPKIARTNFSQERRGYDPDEVDAFLAAGRGRLNKVAVSSLPRRLSAPHFSQARRGYDRREVDSHLTWLNTVLGELHRIRLTSDGKGSNAREAAIKELIRDARSSAEPEAGKREEAGSEGARLIALNLALNGTPRAETQRYLEENFSLSASLRTGILEEVYARVGEAQTATFQPATTPRRRPRTRKSRSRNPDEEGSDEENGSEGARLIALNMALNGTPRAETQRYLEGNFSFSPRVRTRILDEVYARVGT